MTEDTLAHVETGTAPRGAQLAVHGLRKSFGGVKALDGADFEATPGEVAGIIGPNGSGKTTFLNALSGMVPPDAGEARLDGEPLPLTDPAAIAALGVARTFQHIRLLPELSVRENVTLGGLPASLRKPGDTFRLWLGAFRVRRELLERAERVLDVAGVPAAMRDASPSTLPYGAQRRVEIARALCAKPKLIMLDEPAAGMNTAETTVVGTMLREVAERSGITIVIVDHNLDLILGYVDSLTAFDRGRRISYGRPDDVTRDPAVIESYLGPGAVPGRR